MPTLKYKYVFLVSVISLLFSCKNDRSVEDNFITTKDSSFFGNNELGGFGPNTKLVLSAHFHECGEWGGHNEKMTTYINEKREFYLDYEKYKVDCTLKDPNNGTPIQQLETKKTISIHQKEKNYITDYIQRMIKSKINEHFPGHAGNSFTVLMSDSSLLINVYDRKQFDLKSYNLLLADLKLPLTSVK